MERLRDPQDAGLIGGKANTNTAKTLEIPINRIILVIGTAYFLVEYAWKMLFVWGHVVGIYWLFVFADRTVFPAAGILAVLGLVLLLIFLAMRMLRRGNYAAIEKTALASFLSAILAASTVISWFAQYTVHLDAQRIGGRVYYLAVYPMFDDNYGLYECDALGIFCRQVYRSGDIMAAFYAKLRYDPGLDTLSIDVSGEGDIYDYKLPSMK